MNNRLLHTPEGVRDLYNGACAEKHQLLERIGSIFRTYGYRPIETPGFEYMDVFGSDVGTIPSKELYKFFDRDGNTLVLRPDFTPSVARAAARYLMEENCPLRLTYQGSTFVNYSSYQGRLRETTQTGIELIGDGSADADAEVIAMAVESLLAAGLEEFQISVGNVRYFEGLAREAGLDPDTEEELRTLIRNKNTFGAERLLERTAVPERTAMALKALPALFGGEEMLSRALAMTDGTKAGEAASRLAETARILKCYGVDRYVSFDLGMMSTYMYYTGIIFRGYTYGTGDAVVKGGRYDHLLGHFGKDAPSVGFVVVADQLMNALRRQKLTPEDHGKLILVTAAPGQREKALAAARDMRAEGKSVQLRISEQTAPYPDEGDFDEVIRI